MKDIVEFLLREIRGAWRFKWRALAVVWVLALLGWYLSLSMPNVYEARARVFVDTTSRLRDVLGRIAFDPDIEARVAVVRQALLGRSQLEAVAAKTRIDQRARDDDERDLLLEELALQISVVASRQDDNLYTITYRDNERSMALAVVDTLLNSFVEDVIRQEEEGSEQAQAFLKGQIEYYANLLAESEQRLADFKKENIGLMPGDSGGYFERLQGETDALNDLRAAQQIDLGRRAERERQLEGVSPTVAADVQLGVGGLTLTVDDPALERIAELESTLSDYLLRYTELHPDVIAVREQLEQLRAQYAAQRQALGEEDPTGAVSDGGIANPMYVDLQMAINEIDVSIAERRGLITQRERRIAELNALLDTAPQVEAELARLTRDYDNNRSLYNELLQQLEEQRLVNEGDDLDVINFQIIDPPQVGVEPVAPKRMFFIVGALIAALGVGGALAYFYNQMQPVFLDAKQLREISGLPVLGVISMIGPQKIEHERVDWRFTFSAGALAMLFLVVVVVRQPGSEFLRMLTVAG